MVDTSQIAPINQTSADHNAIKAEVSPGEVKRERVNLLFKCEGLSKKDASSQSDAQLELMYKANPN